MKVQSVMRTVPALSGFTCAILSVGAAFLRPLFVPRIAVGAAQHRVGTRGPAYLSAINVSLLILMDLSEFCGEC